MSEIISAKDLSAVLDQSSQILDCRFDLMNPVSGIQAYIKSHIPGALYVDLNKDLSGRVIPGSTGRHPLPDHQEFQSLIQRLGLSKDKLTICYDQQFNAMSARAWWLLKYYGFSRVKVLNGGWYHWYSQGLPTQTVIREILPSNQMVSPNVEWVVDAHHIIQTPETWQLLDARAADRFRGENETIDPVAGHIPGAKSLPFMGNLDADGYFLPIEQIQSRFSQIPTTRMPVHYCGSGATACHNWLAMVEAGMEPGRLYPGSWSHWITDIKRPVERG